MPGLSLRKVVFEQNTCGGFFETISPKGFENLRLAIEKTGKLATPIKPPVEGVERMASPDSLGFEAYGYLLE